MATATKRRSYWAGLAALILGGAIGYWILGGPVTVRGPAAPGEDASSHYRAHPAHLVAVVGPGVGHTRTYALWRTPYRRHDVEPVEGDALGLRSQGRLLEVWELPARKGGAPVLRFTGGRPWRIQIERTMGAESLCWHPTLGEAWLFLCASSSRRATLRAYRIPLTSRLTAGHAMGETGDCAEEDWPALPLPHSSFEMTSKADALFFAYLSVLPDNRGGFVIALGDRTVPPVWVRFAPLEDETKRWKRLRLPADR